MVSSTNNVKQTQNSRYALSVASAMGLRLTSAYRSPSENASVGGSKNSHHLSGTAYDFVGTRNQMLDFADKLHKTGRFKAIYFNNKNYKTGAYVGGHMDHVHVAWDAKDISTPDNGTVNKGDGGSIVEAIQKLLGKLNIDGLFGEATDKAVKDFQEKHGLTVDGSVGSKTWKELTGGGSVFFSR